MEERELHCKVTVSIMADKKAFGPGVAALLRGVRDCCSLQGAARQMDMSYSKAWTVIREAERIWGFPLTECRVGGRRGGGSVLTVQGKEILRRYDEMEESVKAVAAKQFDRFFSRSELEKIKAGEVQP